MTMFLVVREIKRLHEIYQTSENELERRRSKSIVKNTMGQLHKWCWTPFSCCLTLNKYFTFQNKTWEWSQVWKFAVNVTACYLLGYGLAKPLVLHLLKGQAVNVQENVAMLVGMCLYTGLNYLGQRFFAFKGK